MTENKPDDWVGRVRAYAETMRPPAGHRAGTEGEIADAIYALHNKLCDTNVILGGILEALTRTRPQ